MSPSKSLTTLGLFASGTLLLLLSVRMLQSPLAPRPSQPDRKVTRPAQRSELPVVPGWNFDGFRVRTLAG